MSLKQHRLTLDWTPDSKLPERFAKWKAEVEDEILLFEGEDKPAKFICNYVKVCSGERGKDILQETDKFKEVEDYKKVFKALEDKVRPTNEELSASSKYFYLRQGSLSLSEFFKQATDIVEAMKIETNPKDKTLRNLLLNGLASREIYNECLKMKVSDLTCQKVMEIASNIEARNIMSSELCDLAKQTLPDNALAKGPMDNSTLHVIKKGQTSKRFKDNQQPPAKGRDSRPCGWCGSSVRCSKETCPARDDECWACSKIGHWGEVCRSTQKHGQIPARKQHKLHKVNTEAEAQACYSETQPENMIDFNVLSVTPDPKEPHLRPMWFSGISDGKVHLIEAEVDTGAGCNNLPLYLYREAFGESPMDPPTVTIRAFGDQHVQNLGSTLLKLHV